LITTDERAVEASTGTCRLGDDHDRNRQAGDAAEPLAALPRLDREQVLDLALAHDLDATGLDVGVIAGERQTGLLHARMSDRIVEVLFAGDHRQVEIGELVAEKLAHAHARSARSDRCR
jgi:hypothetical protein